MMSEHLLWGSRGPHKPTRHLHETQRGINTALWFPAKRKQLRLNFITPFAYPLGTLVQDSLSQ